MRARPITTRHVLTTSSGSSGSSPALAQSNGLSPDPRYQPDRIAVPTPQTTGTNPRYAAPCDSLSRMRPKSCSLGPLTAPLLDSR